MKRNYGLFFLLGGLLFLGGCWPFKKQPVVVQRPAANQQVGIPLSEGDKSTKLGFFDNSVGAFDDAESFVLDDESTIAKEITVAGGKGQPYSPEQAGRGPQHLNVVYFDYDSDQVRTDQQKTVTDLQKEVSQWAKDGKTIVFKGHSCKWHGTRSYNVALSTQRAEKIATLCSVPKAQIKVFGVGNEEPVVFENSKEGQSPNRRVEVYSLTA